MQTVYVSYDGHTRMVCASVGLTLSLKEILARDLDATEADIFLSSQELEKLGVRVFKAQKFIC